jgi:hypothetical protein
MERNAIEEEEEDDDDDDEEEEEEEICREGMRKTKTHPAGIVGVPVDI